MMDVEIKLLHPAFSLQYPTYATKGSAAIDLRACIHTPVRLEPGESRLIPTGIAIHIADPAYGALILPRSGLGNKGIVIGNLVGLIDSDYQGELMVNVWNRNTHAAVAGDAFSYHQIDHGDRIAQLVIVPVIQMRPIIVDEFSIDTDRGTGGFGSTGR